MSKLEELIRERCPFGVEYKKLKEIAHYGKQRIDASEVNENNYVGVENLLPNKEGKIDANYVPSSGSVIKFDKGNILIGNIRPYLKKIWLSDQDGGTNGDVLVVQIKNESVITPQFLFYLLSSERFFYYDVKFSKGAKMPRGDKTAVMEYEIPVPPLPVQCEIVRILDNFKELTEKLTEELAARKKQYAYYRDKLLSFSPQEKVRNIQLGDIAKFVYGYTGKAKDEGTVRFIRITDISEENRLNICDVKYIDLTEDNKKYLLKRGDLLLARTGATYGKTLYFDSNEPAIYASFLVKIIPDNSIIRNKYYWHFSKSSLYWEQAKKYVSKGGQQQFNANAVSRVIIPVPPLDIQDKIIKILDHFDTLCSDLNIGLPAEIEARKKQYEFYRDALLTYTATGRIIRTDRQTDRQNIIRLIQYVFGFARIDLGTVGKVSMCKRIMKAETGTEGDIPFFKIGTFGGTANAFISKELFEKYKKNYSYPKKGDILISAAGTIGRTVIFDGKPAYFQDSNIVWIDNDESIVLNKYLFYCYQLQPWKVESGGTIARLYNDNISQTEILVPSIAEQERIVSILDRFDRLCNDLTEGLPAEIGARKKQYEYYRDKLLSFPQRKQ